MTRTAIDGLPGDGRASHRREYLSRVGPGSCPRRSIVTSLARDDLAYAASHGVRTGEQADGGVQRSRPR